MSFVAAGTAVAGWATATGAAVGLSGTAALIGGGAILGAGVGGAYSALTGDGNILDSMLTGAGIGGLGGWGLSAAGLGATAGGVGGAAGIGGAGGTTAAEIAAASNTPAVAAASNINPATGLSWEATGSGLSGGAGSTAADPSWWSGLSNMEKLGVGLGGTTLLGMLGGQQEGIATQGNKGNIRPYEFSSAKREPEAGESYYFQPIEYDRYGKATKPLDTSERNYFDQKYTAQPIYQAANGGQVPQLNNMPSGGLAAIQGMREGYAPMTTVGGDIPQFSAGGINMQDGGFVVPADTVSHFGNGSTDAGLKLLGSRLGAKPIKGRGDGMSDSIPAMINGKQPARIADGEAYVPPEMVKKIGKGSPEAGAKRLYNMMDKVRHARTGTKKQGKQIKADKYLPT
jgi:hypothetical protein